MKFRTLLIAAVVSIATLTGYADELDRKKLARSIPEEVVFCARLDLDAARKGKETKTMLDATIKQFNEKLDAIGQFSGLYLVDVNCIWISVVKDKEVLIILEGSFDTDEILNSPIVANSRKIARPGTLITIEMKDKEKDELSHAGLINENIIAFGLPELVDKFIGNYGNGKFGWNKDGLSVMDSLASSDAMFNISVMHLPEEQIKEKPFLANFVNARMEMNILEKKVSATAKINMKDEEKAKALKDLVSSLVVLGITSEIKGDNPELTKAIIDGLKIGNEGKTASMSSGIDIELLRNLLKSKGLELN